jgi:hypothetical protein
MQWKKLGQVLSTPCDLGWIYSHAALLPFVESASGNHRVYFSARDSSGRGHIGSAHFDFAHPERLLRVDNAPVLRPGPLGAFDDNGVTMTWLTIHRDRYYLYYNGWSLGATVPYHIFVGLAISDDGASTFRRVSTAPLLERNDVDPFLTASPCVIIEDNLWRMWYASCIGWSRTADHLLSPYIHIRYAESRDGVHWQRNGHVCIDFESEAESVISRPCVVKDESLYRMWYCYRQDVYRIGYAESRDGLTWERKDSEVGITASTDGWDSQMVMYPFVFDHDGHRYMLYNGNGYGRTGFGIAVLAE